MALLPELLIGARRLVDRLRMSLPFTTRLSFDFRRSRVSISAIKVSMSNAASSDVRTISADVQVKNATNAYIHHSKEALVLFLKLLLVKDLNCQYTFVCCPPVGGIISILL